MHTELKKCVCVLPSARTTAVLDTNRCKCAAATDLPQWLLSLVFTHVWNQWFLREVQRKTRQEMLCNDMCLCKCGHLAHNNVLCCLHGINEQIKVPTCTWQTQMNWAIVIMRASLCSRRRHRNNPFWKIMMKYTSYLLWEPVLLLTDRATNTISHSGWLHVDGKRIKIQDKRLMPTYKIARSYVSYEAWFILFSF